jgi:hypothetical protein
MSAQGAARSGAGRGRALRLALAALLGCAAALRPGSARAEPPSLLLYRGGPPATGAELPFRLPSEAARASHDPLALARALPPAVTRARLRRLSRVEQDLARARQQAAGLDEAGALSTLAAAASRAEALADVAGAAAYVAEVQLRLGTTAAQAGLDELAADALRQAATLDPARRLRAGEARPQTVALAERIAREVATGPRGELTVRCAAPGARVFVDDVDRGPAPAQLSLPVGRHALRVQAPGHATHGAMLDVFEGARPPLEVRLSEHAAVQVARDLRAAVAAGDYAAVARERAALVQQGVALGAVFVLERFGRGERALLLRCDATGCRQPMRLRPGAAAPPLEPAPLTVAGLRRARGWLRATPPTRGAPPDAAGGSPLVLWAIAGAAAVAVAATAAVVFAPEPEQRLRVEIGPAAGR